MKRSRIRKNNRGDSLVLVIGCIALLSIIGVILLAKTMDNRKMKLAEEQAQASFAGAESGSAEMVTVIENAAQMAVEDAYVDMLLEYSLMDDDTRNERYSDFFTKRLKSDLQNGTFQQKLADALNGGEADVTVSFDSENNIVKETAGENGYTDTVRLKNVTFSYSTAGSTTTITTDICVKAQIPDVKAGFVTGSSCAFQDFALISDGSVTHGDLEDFEVFGNFYTGGNLLTTGSSAVTKINQAKKLLVKEDLKIESGAQVWVKADGVTMGDGEGVWAGGISVNGSTFQSENVNLYVKDDLAVEGKAPTVVMKGEDSRYVGYSGDSTATVNHEGSSAITVNEIELVDTDDNGEPDKGLILDLSGLGELFVNGSSYICENNNNWGSTDEDGNFVAAEGVLQGESIAYKDMQGMYLYPSSCLQQKHNPIMDTNVVIGTVSTDFYFKKANSNTEQYIDLSLYVDPAHPYVTRTARLDGGATFATYVYLNFKNEEAAAQYVQEYLGTFLGDNVKSQIKNLGSASRILLPSETITLSNAVSYNGTSATIIPRATDMKKSVLNIAALLAEHRSGGLFTSLRAETGVEPQVGYKMVEQGILNMAAVNELAGLEKEETETDPEESVKTYKFFAHDGDLTIDGSVDAQKYKGMNGILIVNGNLTISSPTTITGLVLVTGEVTQTKGAKLTADARAVEVLLTNEEVAKFFNIYGSNTGAGYLSSEALKISFENWKKN